MAKAGTEGRPAPRELLRMRERLDEWRKSEARGRAFPETLWAAAGRVAGKHGVFLSSRVLGLEYNKLKRASRGVFNRVGVRSDRSSMARPVKFIELTGALPVSPSGCRLSLQNANGHRVQLEMAPSAATEVVLQLCRSGWTASA